MKIRHVFLFFMASAVYALGLVPTTDPDMGWHLMTGEWVLKHGFPRTDPFSFTALGKPWTAHEWLSEVLMRLLYGLGGYPVLMVAFALLGVVVFGFVYRSCPRRPYLAGTLAFVAFLASRYLWGARPQIFNILMIAVFFWLIQGVRKRELSGKWLYALPLLTLIWVNLHSGYLLGIVVLTVFLVGDLFQISVLRSEEGTLGGVGLTHFCSVILLCLIAGCVNPSGPGIYLYPFETLTSKMMQARILEWQTPTFHHPNYWPFLGIMAFGAVAFLLCPPKRNVSNFLIYTGAMVMGLSARRHIPFFAIAAIPMIAQAIHERIPAPAWTRRWSDAAFRASPAKLLFFSKIILILTILAVGVAWTGIRLISNPVIMEKTFPVKAIQYLNKQEGLLEARIFNEYVWGGFLIWNRIPVFIDGRADLYGDAFFGEYLAVADMQGNLRDISAFFDRYQLDGLLVNPNGILGKAFLTNPKWHLAYRDSTAALFLRGPARSESQAASGPKRFFVPLKHREDPSDPGVPKA